MFIIKNLEYIAILNPSFCISIIQRLLIVLHTKDSFFPSPPESEMPASKISRFFKYLAYPSLSKYQIQSACILFSLSCTLCLVFAARIFDGLEQLSKLVDDNRRKERSGMVGDDLDYLTAEEQVSAAVTQDKFVCFLMMYAIIASYAIINYIYKQFEARYLESIGDYTARSEAHEGSGISWSGISSTISSWSVIFKEISSSLEN